MNVGFLGLGTMGLPIGKNIISSCSNKFYFYARKTNVINEMCALGAEFIPTLPQLGEICDVLFVLLNTGEQYEECLLGKTGILARMRNGIIIISATIGEKKIKKIESKCNELDIQLLDAPISGGIDKAISGTLTYIISGDADSFGKIEPLIKSVSNKIYYLGGSVGEAQKIKLLNQMLVGIHMVATAEVFHMGASMGMDLELLYEILTHSAGTSNILENRGQSIIKRDFSTRSTIDIMKKDMKLSVELCGEYYQRLFLNDLCTKLFEIASKKIPGCEDASAIIKLYEESDLYKKIKNFIQ